MPQKRSRVSILCAFGMTAALLASHAVEAADSFRLADIGILVYGLAGNPPVFSGIRP